MDDLIRLYGNKTIKIEGKVFRKDEYFPVGRGLGKKQAAKRADYLRRHGYFARVIKTSKPKGYRVWRRKKNG